MNTWMPLPKLVCCYFWSENEMGWKDSIDLYRAEAALQLLDDCLSGRIQKTRWVEFVGGVQTQVPAMWETAEGESFDIISHWAKSLTHNGYRKMPFHSHRWDTLENLCAKTYSLDKHIVNCNASQRSSPKEDMGVFFLMLAPTHFQKRLIKFT